jgi:hypothetical protein
MEIPMPSRPKTPTKKRFPKISARPAKSASQSRPVPTKIESGQKEGAASKQSRVIAMLRSPGGTTIAAMMQETGWQPHSVRGFLASVVRKKLKLKLQSNKIDGQRVYHIDGQPRANSRQADPRPD